jgi:putative colanic acid biosynthesis UDP-glucose lipid carrier transferase
MAVEIFYTTNVVITLAIDSCVILERARSLHATLSGSNRRLRTMHHPSLPSHPLGRLGRRFSVERPPLSAVEVVLKRCLDLTLAGLLLVTLAPFLAAVSLLIKLDSRGPVIAHHGCRGFNGHVFSIYKFRTLALQENRNMRGRAGRNPPRQTRLSYLLRSTGIDELPQLVNVLKGQMSLVGPRPHAVGHDDQYAQFISNSASQQHLKPGLVGLSQISQRTAQPAWREDFWYIKNWSFLLDLKIIALTLFELIPRQDEY